MLVFVNLEFIWWEQIILILFIMHAKISLDVKILILSVVLDRERNHYQRFIFRGPYLLS